MGNQPATLDWYSSVLNTTHPLLLGRRSNRDNSGIIFRFMHKNIFNWGINVQPWIGILAPKLLLGRRGNRDKLHSPPMLADKTNFGLVLYNHANFYWFEETSSYWSVK